MTGLRRGSKEAGGRREPMNSHGIHPQRLPFLPEITEVENDGTRVFSSIWAIFLSFRAIFNFHDYGRKGTI